MVLLITRTNNNGGTLRLTITTNDLAHSALSDDEELRDGLIEVIHKELAKHLKKEASRYVKGKDDAEKNSN